MGIRKEGEGFSDDSYGSGKFNFMMELEGELYELVGKES